MPRHSPAPTQAVDLLGCMTLEQLKRLGGLVGTRLPTRKADIGRVILDSLAGDGLQRVWDRLNAVEHAAVAEVVHSDGVRFPSQKFRAKYGVSPVWGSLDRWRNSPSPGLLRLLFYPVDGALIMPTDLKERLARFVPPPPPTTIESSVELPAPPRDANGPDNDRVPVTRRTEVAAARELQAVLRLVDAGQVSVSEKTRRASAKTIDTVGEVLEGGDFYHREFETLEGYSDLAGPIRAFAWPLLVQAGGLAKSAGSKLQLTPAGRKALGEPPAKTLGRIWRKWVGTTFFDEMSRIECVKGQSAKGRRHLTAVGPRRQAIEETLSLCPTNRWIELGDLFQYVIASEHPFTVARDEWGLYLGDQHYGLIGELDLGYLLEHRYALCLLFEYAATLGLLDVSYVSPAGARNDFSDIWALDNEEFFSRYDGLQHVRITRLGASVLDIPWDGADESARSAAAADAEALGADTAASSTVNVGSGSLETVGTDPSTPAAGAGTDAETTQLQDLPVLRVLPDHQVVVTDELSHADRLALDNYALPVSDRVWRLEAARLLSVLDQGGSIGEIRQFLRARSHVALPNGVSRLLEDVEARGEHVRDGGMVRLVVCHDAALAALIANDRRTKAHCMLCGDRSLVVPAASERAFRKGLQAVGYRLAPGTPNG